LFSTSFCLDFSDSKEDMTGLLLGSSSTVVTPPAAAARARSQSLDSLISLLMNR
jgi:hypothetical protein